MSALDSQVGGSHYKNYPIQPIEYAMANHLNYCQANSVKYVTRCYDKGKPVEDLRKAIHNIEILIELIERSGDVRHGQVRRQAETESAPTEPRSEGPRNAALQTANY